MYKRSQILPTDDPNWGGCYTAQEKARQQAAAHYLKVSRTYSHDQASASDPVTEEKALFTKRNANKLDNLTPTLVKQDTLTNKFRQSSSTIVDPSIARNVAEQQLERSREIIRNAEKGRGFLKRTNSTDGVNNARFNLLQALSNRQLNTPSHTEMNGDDKLVEHAQLVADTIKNLRKARLARIAFEETRNQSRPKTTQKIECPGLTANALERDIETEQTKNKSRQKTTQPVEYPRLTADALQRHNAIQRGAPNAPPNTGNFAEYHGRSLGRK